MPGFEIKVEGLAELQDKLNQLKGPTAKRVMNKALRAGGAVFQQAVAEAAPERPNLPSGTALPPGALRHDIGIRTIPTGADAASSLVAVGPGKLTAHAARLVEYGHRQTKGKSRLLRNGKTKGPGVQVGIVPPHPFMRPAFESSQQAATDAVVTSLQEDLINKGGK